MHTKVFETAGPQDEPSRTTFVYNSDMSGDVHIYREDRTHPSGGTDKDLYVPGHELIEFVVQHIINQKIAELEQTSVADFIKQMKL